MNIPGIFINASLNIYRFIMMKSDSMAVENFICTFM